MANPLQIFVAGGGPQIGPAPPPLLLNRFSSVSVSDFGARDVVQPPPGGTPSWTPIFRADFRNGVSKNGQLVFGDAFSFESRGDTDINTVYDTSDSISQGCSAKCLCVTGAPQDKWFGGNVHRFAPTLGNGDEVWVRYAIKFSSDFNFVSSIGHAKWMAWETNGGGNERTFFPSIESTTDVTPDSWHYDLANPTETNELTLAATPINRDTWTWLQHFVHIGKPNRADGWVRLWVGDNFEHEDTICTLTSAASAYIGLEWGDYWNGGFQNIQEIWSDEWIMASSNDPPTDLDGSGNPYIPTSIRVADWG